MGQRCCRPAMRTDPKHIYLLDLIYRQTLQNTHHANHTEVSEYLAKKGYIRTLIDYLSSHLNQISTTVVECKNKQIGARSKGKTQVVYCCITSQILQRIVGLCRQVKLKHASKHTRSSTMRQESEQITGRVKSNVSQRTGENRSKIRTLSKHKRKQKIQYKQGFFQQQIASNVIETCGQILKQTLNSKGIEKQLASENAVYSNNQLITNDQTQYYIMTKVQNTLYTLLENQESLIKVKNGVLKQVLDILLAIVTYDRNNQNESSFRAQLFHKKSPSLRFSQQISPYHNKLKTPDKLELQNKQFEIGGNIKHHNTKPIINLNLQQSQFQKLKISSLQNYQMIFKNFNSHFVNTNQYKYIIREHLPRLLEVWAKTMVQNDKDNRSSLNLSEISENLEESASISYDKSRSAKQKNIKIIYRLIRSIMKEFFNGYFSFRQSEYIYRQLMLIFDKLSFSQSKIKPIEQLVFEAMKKSDLRQSVTSKWFDYLLNYLGMVTTATNLSQSVSDKTKQKKVESNNSQLNNYFTQMNLQMNFATQKSDYIYWSNQQNILGCLRTIQRWLRQKEVNIEDTLTYKRNKLFVAVLANFAWGLTRVNEQIYQLIVFLIENDIRCQGYLITNSLYLVRKAKISYNGLNENGWDHFYHSWKNKHYNLRFDKNQEIPDKGKTSTYLKQKNSKNSLKDIELINIELFIDQIITLASYPFLTELNSREPLSSVVGVEDNQLKRSSSVFFQNSQNPKQLQLTKRESQYTRKNQVQIRRTQNQHRNNVFMNSKDSIKQKKQQFFDQSQNFKYMFKQAKRETFLTVFEEIIQILFQQIDFHRLKKNYLSQIKLTGLFLVSNFTTMMAVAGKTSKINKNYSFVFRLMSKINNFLGKTHNEIKILCYSQQQNSGRFLFDSENQFSNNRLQIFKQASIFRQSFDKPSKTNNLLLLHGQIMNSVHKWIYPAFSHNLLPTEFQKIFLRSEQQKTIQSQQIVILNSKILLNIIMKIYCKNLVNICIQNKENRLNKTKTLDRLGSEDEMPEQERNKSSSLGHNSRSMSLNNKQELQFLSNQNNDFIVFFNPFIQLYEVFIEFYTKYKAYKEVQAIYRESKQGSNQKKQQQLRDSKKNTKNQADKKREQGEKADEQKRLKEATQTYEKINRNYQKLKQLKKLRVAQSINLEDKSRNSQKNKNKFLQQVTEIEEPEIRFITSNPTKQNEQNIFIEAEEIITYSNFCPLIFYLIDSLTKQSIKNHKVSEILCKFDSKLTFSKTQNYLIKQLINSTVVEEVQTRSRCDFFSRFKKKQLKASQLVGPDLRDEKQILNSASKTADTNFSQDTKGQFFQSPLIGGQILDETLYKTIQTFQRKYQLKTSKQRGESLRDTSIKKTGRLFNLAQNDYQLPQSEINSESLNDKRVDCQSFNQVLSQINRH